MQDLPSLVIFGSLSQVNDKDQLQQLSDALGGDRPLFQPIFAALSGLDTAWHDLLEHDEELSVLTSAGGLVPKHFARFMNADNSIHNEGLFGLMKCIETGSGSNMVTMPLTIVSHIVQYHDYLQSSGLSHAMLLESLSESGAGVQGFCAGLLSAVAVAGAMTQGETMVLAARSIQIAFAIGAYIDADMARSRILYKSVAVRWRSPGGLDDVRKVLDKHPDVSTILHHLLCQDLSLYLLSILCQVLKDFVVS